MISNNACGCPTLGFLRVGGWQTFRQAMTSWVAYSLRLFFLQRVGHSSTLLTVEGGIGLMKEHAAPDVT